MLLASFDNRQDDFIIEYPYRRQISSKINVGSHMTRHDRCLLLTERFVSIFDSVSPLDGSMVSSIIILKSSRGRAVKRLSPSLLTPWSTFPCTSVIAFDSLRTLVGGPSSAEVDDMIASRAIQVVRRRSLPELRREVRLRAGAGALQVLNEWMVAIRWTRFCEPRSEDFDVIEEE